ncbi:MAG: DegT/DnrJ/EryC1/StrS family aminotransferase [Bryobacteraceae bacterium]
MAKQFVDASGKGPSSGYRVSFRSRMYGYTEDEIQAVVDVLRSDRGLTQGEYQEKFEADFKAFTGAAHAAAISSGTGALWIAGRLCGLQPGDEVIIPAYTFCATAVALGATGARIVWADIDPASRTISPEDFERKITRRTKAVVPVHLLGMPCDMDAILEIAARRGIRVIEDCAQAPGARYKGRRVGSMGDFGCFSFNGAKNLTTLGEGGMLTVRDTTEFRRVEGIRHNGVHDFAPGRQRYWVPAMSNVDLDQEGVWPQKLCMNEAQCAIGSLLLKRLDSVNATLRAQLERMRALLAPSGYFTFQDAGAERESVAHACVVGVDTGKLGASREDLMDVLTSAYSIKLIVQYYPLYKYPLFQKMGLGDADCPNLEDYWPTSYSYPWWCGVPDETLTYMAASTLEAVAQLRAATAVV